MAARRHSIARCSRSAGFNPRSLKNLFTANSGWAGLLEVGGLRAIEVESVSKNAGLRHLDPGCEALYLRQWALPARQIPVQHPGLELGSLRLKIGPCPLKRHVAWSACSPARLRNSINPSDHLLGSRSFRPTDSITQNRPRPP